MGKFFSSAITWIILLLLAIIALILGLLLGWFDSSGDPDPAASTPGTTAGPSADPGATTGAFGTVTTGAYVPEAEALTSAVLASAGSGWVVAIDDTTQIDTSTSPATTTAGDKILYLISPVGVRYELANLDSLGLDSPNLVAWDQPRDLVLLSEDNADLKVLNMATGAIGSSWTYCGDPSPIHSGQARGGNWLVRGGCQGEGFDGIYTDAGVLVPSTIVGAGAFFTVNDIGPVQMQHEFERAPDERFMAFYADGTSATIPSSVAGDCYPLGKGRGATLAVYCYSDTGDLSVWDLPVDGSAPHQVVTASQLVDFAMAAAGLGAGDFWVTDFCSDSALAVIQFSLGDAAQLGVLYGGTVEEVGPAARPYQTCHAAEGTAALVSGGGVLDWVDFDSGSSVNLLPGTTLGDPIRVVGTDGYTALRQP